MEYQEIIQHLENHFYTKLDIKRYDNDCFLIVYIENKPYVFVDKSGKQKTYRHGWQITRWLKNRFDIELHIEEST